MKAPSYVFDSVDVSCFFEFKKFVAIGNSPFLIGFFHSMTTDISVLRTDKLQDYTARKASCTLSIT